MRDEGDNTCLDIKGPIPYRPALLGAMSFQRGVRDPSTVCFEIPAFQPSIPIGGLWKKNVKYSHHLNPSCYFRMAAPAHDMSHVFCGSPGRQNENMPGSDSGNHERGKR